MFSGGRLPAGIFNKLGYTLMYELIVQIYEIYKKYLLFFFFYV